MFYHVQRHDNSSFEEFILIEVRKMPVVFSHIATPEVFYMTDEQMKTASEVLMTFFSEIILRLNFRWNFP